MLGPLKTTNLSLPLLKMIGDTFNHSCQEPDLPSSILQQIITEIYEVLLDSLTHADLNLSVAEVHI